MSDHPDCPDKSNVDNVIEWNINHGDTSLIDAVRVNMATHDYGADDLLKRLGLDQSLSHAENWEALAAWTATYLAERDRQTRIKAIEECMRAVEKACEARLSGVKP